MEKKPPCRLNGPLQRDGANSACWLSSYRVRFMPCRNYGDEGVDVMKIIMLLFLLIGLGVFISSLLQIARALKCQTWPKITGVILNTTIKTTGGTRGKPGGYATTSHSYLPVIRYKYNVQGEEYVSDVRCLGDYAADEQRAKEILSKYSKGEEVGVYYSPKNAKISVLETEVRYGLLLPLGIGLIMAGVGAYALVT